MTVRLHGHSVRAMAFALSLVAALSFTAVARGQCQIARIRGAEASTDAEFGFAVAAYGSYAVMGAPREDETANNAGAVYVYRRTGMTWSQTDALRPSDAGGFDLFGAAVAISGSTIAVGSPLDDDGAGNGGAVYVFTGSGSTWTQQSKLVPIDAGEDDEFGLTVSLDGDTLVVGSRNDQAGLNAGAAYIFRRNGATWSQEAKLTASDAASEDQFGTSVSISGDFIAVGARLNDDNGSESGSAYIFRRNGSSWMQEAKLTASDAAAFDEFGASVAIAGTYVVVGARLDDLTSKPNAGSAYVFRRSGTTWIQEAKLTASDSDGDHHFGDAVAMSGNIVIVGTPQHDQRGIGSGAAYVFTRNGTNWSQKGILTPSETASGDFFSFSVAVSGNYGIIGSPGDDFGGATAGTSYVFAVDGDCNSNASPDACDIISGVSSDQNNDGFPDECNLPGDQDGDGDVDLRDIASMQRCFRGAGIGLAVGCAAFDVEPDGDVDLSDASQVVSYHSGP